MNLFSITINFYPHKLVIHINISWWVCILTSHEIKLVCTFLDILRARRPRWFDVAKRSEAPP